MAKDSKGHGSNARTGHAYAQEMGYNHGAQGKSLRTLMRIHDVKAGTGVANAMSRGHAEGRKFADTAKANGASVMMGRHGKPVMVQAAPPKKKGK
jgi:hypothetical protein